MEKQLEVWEGDFGVEYTERNTSRWQQRKPAFEHILAGLDLQSILEVGCNRGMNLEALEALLPEECEITAIEPNKHAVKTARETSPRFGIIRAHAYDIPFKDGFFDLAFTCCVLIHVPVEDLSKAIQEIYRVSKRYILVMEYFAEEETTIHYRGHDNLLWKRNFLKHYQDVFPDLRVIKEGYYGDDYGFDRVTWWLLEKPAF